MGKEDNGMAAIKLPVKQIDFVRRNPKIAEVYGKLLCSYIEAKDMLKQLQGIMANPGNFIGLLENGTKEDLESFIIDVIKNENQSIYVPNVTEEQAKQITASLGTASHFTPVAV